MKAYKHTLLSEVEESDMVSTLEPDYVQHLMGELTSLKQGAANAATTVERRRWQVLVLIASGMPRQEVSMTTSYSLRTIRQIVQRYRKCGAGGLIDGRKHHTTPTLLSASQLQALCEALQHPPLDGSAWTGPKVAHWIATTTGQQVHRQRGWEYLQRLRSEPDDIGELSPARTGKAGKPMKCSLSAS
jgi:transposase